MKKEEVKQIMDARRDLSDILTSLKLNMDKSRAIFASYSQSACLGSPELSEAEIAIIRANHYEHEMLFTAAFDYLAEACETVTELSNVIEGSEEKAC